MQAVGCAGAALAALEHKLTADGIRAGSVLVWCSSAAVARGMAAAADAILPLGTYDLPVVSEVGVAQAVLRAADSPMAATAHYPVAPAAATALMHKVLAVAPPSTLRPPNDPFKYQGDIERVLFALRYHGVTPDAMAAALAASPPPPARQRALRDLLTLHAALVAEIAATHTFDHADVVAAAVRLAASAPDVCATVRDEWPHAILCDTHAFTRPAVALATALYGSGGTARVPPLAYGDPAAQLARRWFPVPAVQAVAAAAGWRWQAVNDARFTAAPLVDALSRRLVVGDSSAGGGGDVHDAPAPVATEYQPWHGAAAYVQGVQGAGASFVAAAKLQLAAVPGGGVASPGGDAPLLPLPATGADATAAFLVNLLAPAPGGAAAASLASGIQSSVVGAARIGVVCKSATAAAAMTAALAPALGVAADGSAGQQGTRLQSEYASRLRDLPVIRTLLAVLGVIAHPADAQSVYAILANPPYAVPHADIVPLLKGHRVGGDTTPLWTWIAAAGRARSGGAPRDPRRRGAAAAAATTAASKPIAAAAAGTTGFWDPSPLAPLPPDSGTPPPLITGAAGSPPTLPSGVARALADVAAADDAYSRTGSVAAALVAFLRKSGMHGALVHPHDLPHAMAGDGVAALLRIVTAVESPAPTAAKFRGGGRGARQPTVGLPFVLEYLVRTVHEEGASFRSGSADGGGEGDLPWRGDWTAPQVGGSDADAGAVAAGGDAGGSGDGGGFDAAAGSSGWGVGGVGGAGGGGSDDSLVAAYWAARGCAAPPRSPPVTPPAATGVAAHSPRTIVVTTASRALTQQFDVVVIAGATDTAYPGSDIAPAVDVPWEAIAAGFEAPTPGATVGGAATPASPTARSRAARDEYVAAAGRRLRAIMVRAAIGVLFLVPPSAARRGTGVAAAGRRSRFIDEMLGLPPLPLPPTTTTPSTPSTPTPTPTPTPHAEPSGTAAAASASSRTPASPVALLPLSFTRMSDYLWCPHRHTLARTVGLRVPPSPMLLYGRALHAAVAAAGDALLRAVDVANAAHPPPAGTGTTAGPRPAPWSRVAAVAAWQTALASGGGDGAGGGRAWAGAIEAALPAHADMVAAMHAAYSDTWQHGRAHGSLESALEAAGDGSDVALHADALAAIPDHQARELYATACAAVEGVATREREAVRRAVAALRGDGGGGSGGTSLTPALPVLVEHTFRLPLPAAGVELTGVIDRVDLRLCRGSPAVVTPVIREFKSGLQWRAEGALASRARSDNLQAAVYATALRELLAGAALPVGSVGGGGLLAAPAACFESIETGDAVDVPPGAAGDAGAVLAALRSTADGMRAATTPATPSAIKCSFCRFARVCQYAHGVHAALPLTQRATATLA